MEQSPAFAKASAMLRAAQRGDEAATEILRAAELDDEALAKALSECPEADAIPFALLYGAQRGSRLAAHLPRRAMALADLLERAAEEASGAAPRVGRFAPTCAWRDRVAPVTGDPPIELR